MEVGLSLSLPRDEMSVPVARRIVETSMQAIGVLADCSADVALALTEAATNVLKHAGPGEEYEVRFHLDNEICTVDVVDLGAGFDTSALGDGAASDSESGRGVQLMRALVDDVHFESDPADGTFVRLRKSITYGDGTLLDRAVGADPR